MNNSYQAQKGFKTFLVTLVISLGIFIAVYYVTSYPSYKINIEESTGGELLGRTAVGETELAISPVSEEKSPFRQLNDTEMAVSKRVVLAGSDENIVPEVPAVPAETAPIGVPSDTPESTVPDTGSFAVTISLFFSLCMLGAGLYYVYLGPRKLALKSFEDHFLS